MANNLGLDPFPDPVGHFGGPWRPFWILQAVRRCRRWASAPGVTRLVFLKFSWIVFLISRPGCHNPSQRGNIVDRKFALSHRKFQLISAFLLLLRVDWVKLSEICYFFLEKINSFETVIYFLWILFIQFNLCYDKYVFVLTCWLEYSLYLPANTAFLQEILKFILALTGNEKNCDTL